MTTDTSEITKPESAPLLLKKLRMSAARRDLARDEIAVARAKESAADRQLKERFTDLKTDVMSEDGKGTGNPLLDYAAVKLTNVSEFLDPELIDRLRANHASIEQAMAGNIGKHVLIVAV